MEFLLIGMFVIGVLGVTTDKSVRCPTECIKYIPVPATTPYVEQYPSGLLKAKVKNG